MLQDEENSRNEGPDSNFREEGDEKSDLEQKEKVKLRFHV